MSVNVLHTYSGREVIFIFGPIIIEGGKGPDEFLRIEKETNTAEDEAGVDGEVCLSIDSDNRHTIILTLMQSSIHNAQLLAMSELLRAAPGGLGAIHPVFVKNPLGAELHAGQNAWIEKPADTAFARKSGSREWRIRVASLTPA
jgi:hypothetical protein